LVFALSLLAAGVRAEDAAATIPAVTRAQLEADWLTQARLRYVRLAAGADKVTPEDDAVGGCDGVIDGKWGFHTQLEQDPWWQVDLGDPTAVDRLRLYNRCDGFESRAAHIQVLLSGDGQEFRLAYTHDGSTFRGQPDQKPLEITLQGQTARYIRLQLPGQVYFHLDEVVVLAEGSDANVALHKPATQSSVSPWSVKHANAITDAGQGLDWPQIVGMSLARGRQLATALQSLGVNVQSQVARLQEVEQQAAGLDKSADEATWKSAYFAVRTTVRELALSNPLLAFDNILFAKRAPTMFPHLSDQCYGWWARPGGGLYVLERFKSPDAQVRSLTAAWPAGNFHGLDVAPDATKAVFAYSRYYPHVANVPNKRDKNNVEEDVFYHLFEMDLVTGEYRQLTRGKYDDFDGRYLPTGDVLFLSTRKGQFLQTSQANTQQTIAGDLPDSYVRCGGDDSRPVPVFTMHAVNADGTKIWPVSAFETFEYTPSIAQDGRVLYCRWDYIDRFNGHFFSLWSSNPDGTNAQLVYGNYTVRPQATLEPRSIPHSNKMLFTAAAHHSITGGSLVLLDPSKGNEGEAPLTRLTPEVPFPETEENVGSYYANPWPLSEDFYLVSWSNRQLPPHGRYEDDSNPVNAQGLYLCDRFGNLELLHRDPDISSMSPIPIQARPAPKMFSGLVHADGEQVGNVLLQDIYQGLTGIERGAIKRLRIVGVLPKVQPHMNTPSLGVSREETGKFIVGTVPVEPDGSAYFRIPSGLSVFFQALDGDGFALQTMRSLTYVQPGQTLSCIGCHESRYAAPGSQSMLALARGPSKITPDVEGTWPLRFDTLVQPVMDQKCTSCHQASAPDAQAAKFDLSAGQAWQSLIGYANGDLSALVFERDASIPGDNPSRQSKLLKYLQADSLHRDAGLTREEMLRLAAWMDTYGQTQGAFSPAQEEQLTVLREELRQLFESP
jgi:hypothetical protein